VVARIVEVVPDDHEDPPVCPEFGPACDCGGTEHDAPEFLDEDEPDRGWICEHCNGNGCRVCGGLGERYPKREEEI
jgi:hypothetical protein